MSALPPDLARLSALEKIDLISLLLESIPEDDMVLPKYRREILRQGLDELRRNPVRGPAWEVVRAELERAAR